MKSMRVAYAAVINFVSKFKSKTCELNPELLEKQGMDEWSMSKDSWDLNLESSSLFKRYGHDTYTELPRRSYRSVAPLSAPNSITNKNKPFDDLKDIDPELLDYDYTQAIPRWKKLIHSLCAVSYLFVTFAPTYSFATKTVTVEEVVQKQPNPAPLTLHLKPVPEVRDINVAMNVQDDGSLRLSLKDNFNPQQKLDDLWIKRDAFSNPYANAQGYAFTNLFDAAGHAFGFKYKIQGLGTLKYTWESGTTAFKFDGTAQPTTNMTFCGANRLILKNGDVQNLSHTARSLFLLETMRVTNIENLSPEISDSLVVGVNASLEGRLTGQSYKEIHVNGEANLTDFEQKEGVLRVSREGQVVFKGNGQADQIISQGDVGFDNITFQANRFDNQNKAFFQSGAIFIDDMNNSPDAVMIFENKFAMRSKCTFRFPEALDELKTLNKGDFHDTFGFEKINVLNLIVHKELMIGDDKTQKNFWKNLNVRGNLNLGTSIKIDDLNELKDLEVQGTLKISTDDLSQRGELKLPNIRHLEISGKSARFLGDLELPALSLTMIGNVAFGWANDDPNNPLAQVYKEPKMASLTLTHGDLNVFSGGFDGRWGQIMGLNGQGIVRTGISWFDRKWNKKLVETLTCDILLGDLIPFQGDGSLNSEDISLGYMPAGREGGNGYRACSTTAYRSNGSFFGFKQGISLNGDKTIRLKGAHLYTQNLISMTNKEPIEIIASLMMGRNGLINGKSVKIQRMPAVTIGVTERHRRSGGKRFNTNHFREVITSDPSVSLFTENFTINYETFDALASNFLIGNDFTLNNTSHNAQFFQTVARSATHLNTEYKCITQVGKNVNFQSNGMKFSMDASAQAIFVQGTNLDILNVGQLQTLRDRTRSHHIVLNHIVESSPHAYGLKALPVGQKGPQEIAVYENMLPGGAGFSPNLSRSFFMKQGGHLPFNAYINPLKNGDMDMLMIRVLGACLGKNFLQDVASGTFVAGRYILPYLVENGRRFENAFFKQFNRQPTLEEIQQCPLPMIWFQGNGRLLETHLHIPGHMGTKYLTGAWEANKSAIELGGYYNQTDMMLHTLYDNLVYAKGDVSIQATTKRIGSRRNYHEVKATETGMCSEAGAVEVVSDQTLQATGATFDTHEPGLLQGAETRFNPLVLQNHSERTKKHKKKKVTVVSDGFTHEGVVIKGQSQFSIVATQGDNQTTASVFNIPKIKFSSPLGVTALLAAIDQQMTMVTWRKKNTWRMKMGGHQEASSTVHPNTFAPGMEIDFDDAAHVLLQHRQGEICPELAKALKDHESLFFEPLEDTYQKKHFKTKRVVNPKFVTIIGAALSVLTAGTSLGAATAASITTNTALQSAIQAGLKCILSQVTTAFIANEGHIGKTLKQAFSADNLKALGVTMVSAGFVKGVADQLNMRLDAAPNQAALTITERAQKAALQFVGDTTAESTVGGKSFRKAFVNNARGGAGDLAQEIAASKIGVASKDGKIDQVTRYGAHALTGGLASKIRKKDWRSGAVGAVIAELTGDIYRSNLESNGQFDPNSSTFGRELAVGEELAKFFATTTACLLDLDPAEAARSGAIAVRENSLATIIRVGAQVLGKSAKAVVRGAKSAATTTEIMWEIGSIIYEEDIEQNKKQVCEKISAKTGASVDTVEKIMDGAVALGGGVKALKNMGKGAYAKLTKKVVHEMHGHTSVQKPGKMPKSSKGPKKPKETKDGEINKNSLEYVGDTHVYAMKDGSGKILKYGESAQGVRKRDGQSKRAHVQVRELEKMNPDQKFDSQIVRNHPSKREARLGSRGETRYIDTHRKIFGKDSLPLNKNRR